MNKSNKFYRVHTGIEANAHENEFTNWTTYNVIAEDAIAAISAAKKMFTKKGEYAVSVDFVDELSETQNKK